MKTSIKKIRDFLEEKGMLKHLGKAPVVIAAVVVAATVYALILPALTLEKETYCGHEAHVHSEDCYELVPVCGKEETDGGKVLSCSVVPHVHTDACRNADGNYICGYADYTIHKHDKYCYDEDGNLVCKLIEAEEHQHDASCYTEGRNLTCGQEESAGHTHSAACYKEHRELICGQAESTGHTHTDACYDADGNLICGQEESAGHTHTDACYSVTQELTCGQAESAGHTHTDACYSITSTLTCGKEEIVEHEHTQECFAALDHEHTDACRNEKGYLVCGGLICGKTEVLKHQHTSDCWKMQEAHKHTDACMEKQLTCKLPEHEHTDICYDVDKAVAARQEADAERNFIATTEDEEDTDNIEGTEAEAVLPACGKEEHEHTALECYDADGNLTCVKEEHKHTDECYDTAKQIAEAKAGATLEKTYEDENVKVTAAYDESANIPEEAELIAEQITAESDPEHFAEREAQMREQLGNPDAPMNALFKIGFYVNGEEIEPESDVIITIQMMNGGFAVGDPVTVVHFRDEDTETLSGTDVEADENGGQTTSFRTGSFSEYGLSPIALDEPKPIANDGTEKDLQTFLKGASIKGASGEVKPGGTLNVGEKYVVTFQFGETKDNNGIQFDENSTYTYTIPENFEIQDFGPKDGVIKTEDGKSIGYTYEVKDGKLIIRFKSGSKPSVNDYRNVTFDVDLDTVLRASGGDENLTIPLGDGTEWNFNINNDPKPSIEKTAGEYNPIDKSVEYTVEIKAAQGDISNLHFTDTLDPEGALEYKTPFEITYTVYDADGNAKETETITVDGATGASFETNGLPDLTSGQRMVVKYKAYTKDTAFDENGNIDKTQKNDVALTGTGAKDFEITDDASVEVSSHLMEKKGDIQNKDGKQLLRWKVQIGDGSTDSFLEQNVTDTLGGGLTFFDKNAGNSSNGIELRVYDAETGEYETVTILWDEITVTGQEVKYKIPSREELEKKLGKKLPEHFYLVAVYYTEYTIPDGESKHTFENSVNTKINGKDVNCHGEKEIIGPVGEADKYIENYDTVYEDGYLEYEVEVTDIAANSDGKTPFRFVDRLRFEDAGGKDIDWYVSNEPEKVKVYLAQGDAAEVELKEYIKETDIGNNCYLPRSAEIDRSKGKWKSDTTNIPDTEVHRFMLVFNTSDFHAQPGSEKKQSYLAITEKSRLRVTYRIPLTAKVYTDEWGQNLCSEGTTIKDLLDKGYTLNNDIHASINGVEKTAEVDYQSPEYTSKVTKTGKRLDNGNMEYRVEFKNWKQDQTTEQLVRDLADLTFSDEFNSEYFQYVDGSLHVEVLKATNDTLKGKYKYTGNSPIKSSTGATTRLEATGDEFAKRDGNHETDGSSSFSNSVSNNTLRGAFHYLECSIEKKEHLPTDSTHQWRADTDEGKRESCRIIFIYQLEPNAKYKEDYVGSVYKLHNDATVYDKDKPLGEDDFDFDYETGMMTKEMVGKDATTNTASFEIELNKEKKQLIKDASDPEKTTLTLTDEMSENMSLLVSTLKVTVNGEEFTDFTYDLDGTTLTIKGLPDKSYIVITYDAKVSGVGEQTITNKASLEGNIPVESEVEDKFDVQNVGSGGTAGNGKITISKKDSADGVSDDKLNGAKFLLYMIGSEDKRGSNDQGSTIPLQYGYEDVYEFNGANGYFLGEYQITDQGKGLVENQYLWEKGQYILVEVVAPTGYNLPKGADAWTYFYYEKAVEGADNSIKVVPYDSVIDILNTSYGYELPETGGPGTTIFALAGITLLGVAGLMYRTELEKRRRRARSESRRDR